MGITVEIVRSVFLKSRSRDDTLGHQRSNNGVEKRKWSSSVRSYLCGNEHNSAEDSESLGNSNLASFRSNIATNSTGSCGYGISSVTTSVRSSEATVTQQIHERTNEKHDSADALFQQQHAALIIQSAFRSFLARRRRDESKTDDDEKQEDAGSPCRGSIGTSVEAQTGNSSDIFSIKVESFNEPYKMRRRTRAQVLKIQEDWDDSTVSSVISKMRMQSRVEAATRRERALAYAFSQQLRICSKKKVNCLDADGDGTNTGWSWLERWMATRQPEITFAEEDSQRKLVRKRMLDVAIEEKESCGSNEVASLIEIGNLAVPKNVPRPNKNRVKIRTSFSRQDSTASSHLCPKQSKDVKKECHIEDEKEKRKRQKQPGSKRDVIKNATTHEVPLQHETEQ